MAQAVSCNAHCSIPRRLNLSRPALLSSSCWKSPRRIGFRVRAAGEAEECNEEACAPEKEVGKVSMEWAVEERTKVLGTFPPTTRQRWTGYVEKDTAGQTNIYSVEPTMYVAESAISSGEAGTSTNASIASSTWTDITPVTGSDLYFGFGGLSVDLLKPGTLMIAALNSWYPDGQVFRSNNSGATWTRLWEWAAYPDINRYYKYDTSLAPWLNPPGNTDTKQIGWMMESLLIDPFDSNHWLYGTGATIFGGRDLTKWDTVHNVTLKSLADGIEETSVQALISPTSGPNLLSGVGDIGGFVHSSLTTAPKYAYLNPHYVTTPDMDFAGLKPATIVRIGNDGTDGNKQVALSADSGATWSAYSPAPDGAYGGKVAISANGDTILWRSATSVSVSRNSGAFTTVSALTTSSVIASDKKNGTVFYAATGSTFYISTDYGVTFKATAGNLGSSTTPVKIVANTNTAGDVWVSTDKGLYHSTNYGATFTAATGVSQAWAIGLGAPKTSGTYASVFAAAVIGGVTGYFRSDNTGSTWVQINDVAHGFGSASSNPVSGDPRVYGRVYIGTNGRGIFYGDVA